jgi:cyclophilin family peptidyl-prolyl cis-trans isomerase
MSRTRHSARIDRRRARARRNQLGRLIAGGAVVIFIAALIWGLGLGPKIAAWFTRTSGPQSWDSPPPMSIDVSRQYYAFIRTANGGEIAIELFAARAPVTVNNFVFLARNRFYDGTTFHRVLEGFMAQGGDPLGTGGGGPGYEFDNEDNGLLFDKPGVVAMANHGPNTNGSQFFITFGPAEWLNGGYTVFGQVIDGMEVVSGLTLRDPDLNPDYPGDAIETITILEE